MPDTRWRAVATSVLIIGIVGLQLQAFVPERFGIAFREWAWPIVDYPMYTAAIQPGPLKAARVTITMEAKSGGAQTFTMRHRRLVGASGGGMFGKTFSRPMLAGDETAARELLRRLNRYREHDPYVSVRVVLERYVFDSEGLRQVDTEEHRFEAEGRAT